MTSSGASPRSEVSRPPRPAAGFNLDALCVVSLLAAAACNQSAAHMAPVAGQLSRLVVDPYLSVDAALASDQVDGLQARAAEIGSAARALGPSAVAIDKAAAQLGSAADLADARTRFGVLSLAIDAYMTDQHLAPPTGVRVAFCPMAMRPWLQKDGTLRNPYYGSQMLTCGSFRN
jgi:hypothetical protein